MEEGLRVVVVVERGGGSILNHYTEGRFGREGSRGEENKSGADK